MKSAGAVLLLCLSSVLRVRVLALRCPFSAPLSAPAVSSAGSCLQPAPELQLSS